jgi:beta-N-acetylhexosaminidase
MTGALIALIVAAGGAVAGAQAPDPLRGIGDRQLAGQRVVAGFEGTRVPGSLKRMIRKGRLAGVVLFADNLPTEAAARTVVDELRSIRRPRPVGEPLLVMVDQEGGLVKRLPGPPTMSASAMGGRGPAASRRQGRRTGRYLRGFGINVDLAPVLDIGHPGGEIAATGRAFGSRAGRVRAAGNAFAAGLERAGTAATAKHFPGFGAAAANTDDATQTIGLGRRALRRREERPFERFAARRRGMVMLSWAIYPALDPGTPAGLSRRIATKELRRRLGFRGPSITDAMDAAAVAPIGGPRELARRAARAGSDLLLFTSVDAARAATGGLLRSLRNGSLPEGRFRASARRTLRLRGWLR